MKAQAPTKLTVQPGDEFNVVYAVDTRFMGTGKWATILESISGSAKEIFKRSPKAAVYLLEQNMPSAAGGSVKASGTYTGYEELTAALEEYKDKSGVHNPLNQCDMSEAIDYVNKNIGGAVPTFMFSFFDPANIKYNSQKGGAILENVSPLTDISLVANIDRENARGYAIDAVKSRTDNIITNYECASEITRHIYEERQIQDTYKVITSSGLTRIKLEKPLTYECFQAARGILTDYSGLADTDKDGLYDFEEIDCLSTLFTVDSYGEVVEYPTFAKCLNARLGKDFYVDVGLEKYKEYLKNENQYTTLSYLDRLLNETRVLPINSDPTSEDGDKDGILDVYDQNALQNDEFPELFVSYINQELIPFDSVLSSGGAYICTVPLSELTEVAGIISLDSQNPVDSTMSHEQLVNWRLMAILNADHSFSYTTLYLKSAIKLNEIATWIKKGGLLQSIKNEVDKGNLVLKTLQKYNQSEGTGETLKQILSAFLRFMLKNLRNL